MRARFPASIVALLGAGVLCHVLLAGCSKSARLLPTQPAGQNGLVVSAVIANVQPTSYSGLCPGTFSLSAEITTRDSGAVAYCWERSDGSTTSIAILPFHAAGTQTVTTSWSVDTPGSFWERIHVFAPNELVSNQAAFANHCGLTVTASASVVPKTYSGPCPATFDFSAEVTSNASGAVLYRWEGSDGQQGPEQTLIFEAAGSQTVTTSRAIVSDGSFWERIHILQPADAFSPKVTFTNSCVGFAASATVSAGPNYYADECPGVFGFSADITANGAGTVTYRWERSDGATGPVESLSFAAAGTQTATTSWQLEAQGNFWQRIHVLSPNDALSNQADIGNYCCEACEGSGEGARRSVASSPR